MNTENEDLNDLSNETHEDHPSFGVAVVVRSSGGKGRLFMSGLEHSNRISLSIRTAAKIRRHGLAHTFPCKEIVRIEFSELQWGQLLSRMSLGSGTPCTITRVNNEQVPECPADTTFKDVSNHAKRTAREVASAIPTLSKDLCATLSRLRAQPSVRKTEVLAVFDDVLRKLEALHMNIAANLPFVTEAIQEHAETILEDAQMIIARHVEQAKMLGNQEGPLKIALSGSTAAEEL